MRMPAGPSSDSVLIREQLRDRGLRRGPAAERLADDMDLVRPELVEEIEVVHRQIADVAQPGRIVRRAEARVLGHEHLELLGQQIEHRQPDRQAVGAVQEQQRRAGAAPQHPDIDVADLVFRFRPRHGIVLLDAPSRAIYRSTPSLQSRDTHGCHRYRAFPPPPLRRASGAAWRMRDPRPADRSDRRRRGARRQSARDLVQGGRAREGRADRQRHGLAQAARARARHRRDRAARRDHRTARQSAQAGEGFGRRTRRCSRWC